MKHTLDSLMGSLRSFLGNTLDEQTLRESLRVQIGRYGDVAFSCHALARELAHEGREDEIASWLAGKLELPGEIEGASNKGGFVNFRLDAPMFSRRVLEDIMAGEYGTSEIGNGKKVIIDYSAPNIGKPLHIGHIRSTILGDSVGRVLRKCGYATHGINYLGDIGLHIGKLLWSYQRFVDHDAWKRDPDAEILRLYVKFGEEHARAVDIGALSNPDAEDQEDSELLDEARSLQARLEAGDPELRRIYERIYAVSRATFDRIYERLGVGFDETTGQSHFSSAGKAMVEEALRSGVARRTEDGAVMVECLKDMGLPPKVILRSDGAALYSTQDLGAAEFRFAHHDFDQMLYVVADEQETYFQQFFGILKKMGRTWSDRCHHLSFGFINLKDARMSSRKGNIVYLEDVLDRAVEYSRNLIDDEDLTGPEREEIAEAVGIGAIKYMVLSVAPKKMIEFSWDRALDLKANSSPSIQYSHARAASLVRGREMSLDPSDLLGRHDQALVKKLAQYPLTVEAAAQRLAPHIIAGYVADLARTFNSFYHSGKIVGSPEEPSRLYLTECFRRVTADALGLLGIDAPDRM